MVMELPNVVWKEPGKIYSKEYALYSEKGRSRQFLDCFMTRTILAQEADGNLLFAQAKGTGPESRYPELLGMGAECLPEQSLGMPVPFLQIM